MIQVTLSGGRFKYHDDGKEKLLSLGTFPDVSLAEARDKRDDARKLLAQNPQVDTSNTRKAEKAAKATNQNHIQAEY